MLKKNDKLFRILLLMELLCLLALLPGAFRQDETLVSYKTAEVNELTASGAEGLTFQSPRLELSAGVYRVRVSASLEQGEHLAVEVKCDYSFFNALRSNVVNLQPGEEAMEFLVYAADKLPSVYLQCIFQDASPDSLLRLEIAKTGLGNAMLIFLLLAAFCLIDFLVVFRRGILDGRITRKQQVVFWALTASVFLAFFPYMTDYIFRGHDSLFHIARINNLKNTLLTDASLPVRIQSNWLCDHGYAVSLFYSDLFLLFPALLMMLGFPAMTAYKLFVFAALAATALIAYFAFKKCVRDEYSALIGSVFYLLAPYHIYNFYERAAVGEFLAMTFYPLVACGLYLLYTEETGSADYRKHKWYIVWGMTCILQSHLLSAEMITLLMALFCAVFWRRTFRRQTLLQLAEATGIVLLINAWFWLPMLYMMNCNVYHLNLTDVEIQSWGLRFSNFFQLLPNVGNAVENPVTNEPMQIGAGSFLLLLLYPVWRRRSQHHSRVCDLLWAFSLFTMLMGSYYFPWNSISKLPGIGYVIASFQFAFRWMAPASLICSLFAAIFCLQLKRACHAQEGILIRAVFGAAVLLAAASAVYQVNRIVYETTPLYLYAAENIGTTSVGAGEYLLEETDLSEVHYHKPIAEEGLTWSDYKQDGTSVTLTAVNHTAETLHLEIPLLGYKGYAVESFRSDTAGRDVSGRADSSAASASMPCITEETGAHGDLRIAVPGGFSGELHISYEGFPLFRAAEWVSLVSLGALALAFCFQKGSQTIRKRSTK